MPRRALRHVGPPGRALDIGAAGGGNTRVLRAHGWRPLALEYSESGAQVAQERGSEVIRADARFLPVPSESVDLVVAFDILEHIEDILPRQRSTGCYVRAGLCSSRCRVTCGCGRRTTSRCHVRRYDRASLVALIEKAGLTVDEVWSWNVLLPPVAAWRRRKSSGSDLNKLPGLVNAGLSAVIAAERYLPVKSLPGVSLVLRARKT